MICKNCGSKIADNATECPYCLIDIDDAYRASVRQEREKQQGDSSENRRFRRPNNRRYPNHRGGSRSGNRPQGGEKPSGGQGEN